MKLAHLSDTHIGFVDLDHLDDRGVPIRERDFYDAFARAVDAIIAAKVDAVVHAGDLFHRSSPTNRALTEGLRQLKRLADAKIPTVVLAGNHDAPRTVFTGPIIAALESIDGVYPIYRPAAQTIDLGPLAVHGVPHLIDEDAFFVELNKLAPLPDKINVLSLHASVGSQYMMDEFGEKVLAGAQRELFAQFHYTALGHWHGHRVLKGAGTACYSGSTERIRETEADEEKGWVLVDLSDPAQPQLQFQPVATRPQIRVVVETCHQRSDGEILTELRSAADDAELSGAVVHLRLAEMSPEQGAALTNQVLCEPFAAALATVVTRSYLRGGAEVEVVDLSTTSLSDLFAAHLVETLPDEKRRARVLELGRRYLREAEG